MSTTHNQLAELMDFGRVIYSDGTGYATSRHASYSAVVAPDEIQYIDLDGSGSIAGEPEAPRGWEYLTFLTGQHGVGPTAVMHPSNVIPGGIAEHILARPGYYVAVVIDSYGDEDESVSVGWGILHYIGGDK